MMTAGKSRPVEAITDTTMLGLAVAPSVVSWGDYKYAVIHIASGRVAATTKTRAHAWRIVAALAPLGDWTKPADELDKDMVRAAKIIAYRQL